MEQKKSFGQQVASLPANFWYANIMEMFERLAFYGVRAIVALYLVAAPGENGLNLDYTQKGWIFTVWALLQCLIPMVSGGYTDRYGYRKSLAVAFIINIAGYTLMGLSRPVADYLGGHGVPDAGFWVFMLAACMAATGTAIFKPPVQGTVAKATTEETSSLGWGLFYWVVNIGGTAAPFGAAMLRGEFDWHLVFYAAAIVTSVNFLPAFLLYKEPERDVAADGTDDARGPVAVFLSSIANIFKDMRLLAFLLIFSMFFLMFMQLWDLMPNFIDEWVDTSDVAGAFSFVHSSLVQEDGQVKPEMIINIDSASIILLVIPLSWAISRLNKVVAMVLGMLISLVGFVAAGATNIGLLCCIMVFVFAIGEMMCSPTFSAYVGLIAPKDKKALYMGYSNMPFAIGWALGNLISGYLYENISSKFNLARDYMINTLGMSSELVSNKDALPNDQVLESMAYVMQTGDSGTVHSAVSSLAERLAAGEVPQEDVAQTFADIAAQVDTSALREATQLLWDTYDPQMVWYYLGAVGLLGTLGMLLFYFVTPRSVESAPATEETDASQE